MRMVDHKRGIRFKPRRGGEGPGGMGALLFKLRHGFEGYPGGKITIHLVSNFAFDTIMSRKYF
jgi:hypothetical protein